jgi:hypothetical protein
LHPSTQMSRMAAIEYRLLLCEGEESGFFVPNFTSRNGFPGRCAINTETSAVKYLRVRFRSGGMVAVFVLCKRWQIDSFRSAIQGHRVRQVARLSGECVVVWLPLCPWMVERFFSTRRWQTSNAGASKTLGMWEHYPPAVPFSIQERGGSPLKRRNGL